MPPDPGKINWNVSIPEITRLYEFIEGNGTRKRNKEFSTQRTGLAFEVHWHRNTFVRPTT
jgi:hypothetical protein